MTLQLEPGHLEADHHFKILAIKHKRALEGLCLIASAGVAGCDAVAAGG